MNHKKITIGRFGSTFGIQGWIKIISFTDPVENIINLAPLFIKKNNDWQQLYLKDIKKHGKNIIAKINDVNDPETAAMYTNLDIAIEHEQLPKLAKNEYYWSDLEGLNVINKEGQELGQVDHLFATGSNDVLVVKNDHERLIPYIDDVVLKIDIENKLITVDWDPEF